MESTKTRGTRKTALKIGEWQRLTIPPTAEPIVIAVRMVNVDRGRGIVAIDAPLLVEVSEALDPIA